MHGNPRTQHVDAQLADTEMKDQGAIRRSRASLARLYLALAHGSTSVGPTPRNIKQVDSIPRKRI